MVLSALAGAVLGVLGAIVEGVCLVPERVWIVAGGFGVAVIGAWAWER